MKTHEHPRRKMQLAEIAFSLFLIHSPHKHHILNDRSGACLLISLCLFFRHALRCFRVLCRFLRSVRVPMRVLDCMSSSSPGLRVVRSSFVSPCVRFSQSCSI